MVRAATDVRSVPGVPSPRGGRAGLALLSAALAGVVSAPCAAQFANGDFYLFCAATPGPGGLCNVGAIIRIVPGTWQASVLTSTQTAISGRGAYDPFRDRLIWIYADAHMELVDSAGVRTPLPYQGPNTTALVAPRGDGRLYTWGTDQMRYFDSANAIHPLMNQTGSAPFTLPGDMRSMIFDPGTNALFVATFDGAADLTTVVKVPLNAAGTAVQGQTTSVSFDVSPGQGFERPVGFSPGPAGKLFLKVDDNSAATIGRMRLIDPATLNVQVFASSGYFGVGGEMAGAYSAAYDRGVVFDTLAASLRSFAQGESGAGSIVPVTGATLTCSSGVASQLLIIQRGTTGCYANCDGSTTNPVLNVNDFICFQQKFAGGDTYANCDGSTAAPVLNVNDFICFQQKFAAGCP